MVENLKKNNLHEKLDKIYDLSEKTLYVLLIIVFFVATVLVTYSAIYKLVLYFLVHETSIVHISLAVADKLLLALMFLEIMHTIKVHMLSENFTNCVEPFLFVAIIASIRRILIISLEISHAVDIEKKIDFNQYMIELSILGVLVVMFIGCIVWIRKNKVCN